MSLLRRSTHAARRQSTRGSAIIETAFIFIAFAAILLTAIDYGQFLYVHNALVERARWAVRWGAINGPTNTTAIQNMVLYRQSTAPTGGTPFLGLTSSNVTVATGGTVGSDDYRLTLQIADYTYTRVSLFTFGRRTGAPVRVSVPLGAYE